MDTFPQLEYLINDRCKNNFMFLYYIIEFYQFSKVKFNLNARMHSDLKTLSFDTIDKSHCYVTELRSINI